MAVYCICANMYGNANLMRGNGKTLSMTAILHEHYYKDNWKILTNYRTTFSEMISIKEMIEMFEEDNESIKDMVMGIDELQVFLDSVGGYNKSTKPFLHLIQQSRKRNVELFYTTQSYGTVHKRLRDQTDVVMIAEKRHRRDGSLCLIDRCNHSHYIYLYSPSTTIFFVFPIERFVDMYNTNEIIGWN